MSSLQQVDSGETIDTRQEDQEAYRFCSKKSKTERMLQFDELPADPYMKNENIKKAHAAYQLKVLATELGKKDFYNKKFLNNIKDRFKGSTIKLDIFAKECVNIIWLMCIQDPPILMEWVDIDDDDIEFDSEKYRFYTKSVTMIDFCVWPVVYLCEKELMLLKGIAQGK